MKKLCFLLLFSLSFSQQKKEMIGVNDALFSINNGEEEKGFSGFGFRVLSLSYLCVYGMLLFALLGDRGKQKQTK